MSYRENLKRDRSRSPPRRDYGRERSPDRRSSHFRDGPRDQFDRDSARDDRSRYGSQSSSRPSERIDTYPSSAPPSRTTGIASSTSGSSARDKLQAKAALEQARRERLEIVKQLTEQTDDVKPKVKKQKVVSKDGEGGEDEEEDEENDEDAAMMEMLGFSGFNTTKGKQVAENVMGAAAGAAARHKERKYRQYMNRRGGFNRPLQKMD